MSYCGTVIPTSQLKDNGVKRLSNSYQIMRSTEKQYLNQALGVQCLLVDPVMLITPSHSQRKLLVVEGAWIHILDIFLSLYQNS